MENRKQETLHPSSVGVAASGQFFFCVARGTSDTGKATVDWKGISRPVASNMAFLVASVYLKNPGLKGGTVPQACGHNPTGTFPVRRRND